MCKLRTAREMWNSFEQDKTKRAYASEVRLHRDPYTSKFSPGERMDKYLNRLMDMRRQLDNMNAIITDTEMVNVLLQGVVDSHRNVVRMFNRNNNGGVAPDLTTVVNVLLGEDETDKACAAEACKEEVQATKIMAQQVASTNPKKKFKKKGGDGKKATKENRKCFFCKKKGHLRAEFFGYKALQAKRKAEGDSDAKGDDKDGDPTSMKMIRTGELGDSCNPPVPIRMVRSHDVIVKSSSRLDVGQQCWSSRV
ncbi:hypothetical protein PC123_g10843 [Phytophthora cactorum]|nr:hypothetical protein PC123_g10843 [Phytophthora cactorum]